MAFEEILAIAEKINIPNQKNSRESLNRAKLWMNQAQQDMSAAELSLNSKLSPKCIENLAEATEKASKATTIFFTGISAQEVKQYRHFTPGITLMLMEGHNIGLFLDHFKKRYPSYIKDDRKLFEKQIKDYEKNNYIFQTEKVKNDIDYASQVKLNLQKVEYKSIMKEFEELGKEIKDEKFNRFLDLMRNNNILNFIGAFMGNFLMGIIVYPHYVTSKYPENPSLNPSDYQNNNELIELLPNIVKFSRDNIDTISELFNTLIKSLNTTNE